MAKPKPASPPAAAKPRKLTPQRENFARLVVTGYSQTEAYRRSFTIKPSTKPATTWNDAYKLSENPDVAARIDVLTAQAAARAGVTKQSMLAEMGFNRAVALDHGDHSVAATSSRDRAKVAGLLTEKFEHTGKDGAAIAVATELDASERSVNDIARRIAFALAEGKRRAKLAPPKAKE